MQFGSTLSADAFPAREFDFMLSNPPYGKSWKIDLERMGGKSDITDPRFVVEHAGDPEYSLITRSSDGHSSALREWHHRLALHTGKRSGSHRRPAMPFMTATASRDEIERFRLERDDVLITKDSEAWNDIGVPSLVVQSADDLVSGYHFALLRPFKEILGTYLARTLQSKGVAYQFYVRADGVTRYGLTHTGIHSVLIPLPPLPEQSAIVRYLDYMDRRIRRYVRAKRKLIALLEEMPTR